MGENTFPSYKVEEIVTFFRTEVLTGQEAKHFSKNDLIPNPKPESVQRLYMRILHLLYRMRPEFHSMIPLMENIQYPEFHERSTAIMSVYLRMRQCLPMCLVYDFTLNDLQAPQKKKTLFVLSGVMNFLKFKKLRMDMILEQQARFRANMDMLQIYTQGIEEAQKKIETLTTIPPDKQAEANELAAALSDLHTAIVQKRQEVNGLNDTIANWKTVIAEKTQKLAQLNVDMSTLKEDITKLTSQIVECLEELKKQMEKMREKVKDIKISIAQKDQGMVELQNRVQGEAHGEAELQLLSNMLQDLQTVMNTSKQRQEEVQELAARYEKLQKELKNLCLEESQLKRALGKKQDKQSKLQIRRHKMKEMNEHHVRDVLGRCDQVSQKREEKASQIQEICRDYQQLRAKMQSLRDVCSKETEKAQALYDNLSSELDTYHKNVEGQIVDLKENTIKMATNM